MLGCRAWTLPATGWSGRRLCRRGGHPSWTRASVSLSSIAGGPLLVLAGPGTGKTTTLVEAAVARVRAGIPVDQLLMLTFSRRAAAELRARVTARLGGTVREPIARTFHSYAFGILRMAAVDGAAPPPRLLSGPEQDLVLRELIDGDLERGSHSWPVELRPALRTRGFAAELRDLLLRAVERGLTGPQLAELGRRQRRPDWVAAGSFLQQYLDVTALAHPGAWDPAELIQAAVDVLRTDPTLLSHERRRRRRIFVDEYQDTDPAQTDLLGLVGGGRRRNRRSRRSGPVHLRLPRRGRVRSARDAGPIRR